MSQEPSDPRVLQRALIQSLRGWRSAGLTHIPRAEVIEPEAAAVVAEAPGAEVADGSPTVAPGGLVSAASHEEPAGPSCPTPSTPESPMPVTSSGSVPPCTLPVPEREGRLAALARKVAKCTRCQELASTRTQTVFGVGNPEARVMFVGEAPGADEDAQGEPFVGRAGQLLNKIIAACGWRREEIYICNILRCRPPGNRNPSDEEAANCREFLDGQIAIVDPEYIVCWGSVAARNLLSREEPIGRLREKWFEYGRAKVLCTYHPSYLLRNPAAKKPVWEDMQRLLAAMGLEPPKT